MTRKYVTGARRAGLGAEAEKGFRAPSADKGAQVDAKGDFLHARRSPCFCLVLLGLVISIPLLP